MTMPRTATRALAGVCALTLLFAACGGDDDEGSDTDDTEQTTASTEADESTASEPDETTASEPEEETTTSEDEGDPEAVAVAEAVNLTIDDFADGWAEEAPADEDGEDDLDQCFATVDIEATTVGEAETPTFSAETPDGQGGQVVSMQTVVFDSPDTASTVLSEVSSPEFATCAQQLLTQSEEGTEAVLTPAVDDPPLGEESVGIAGAVQIPASDGSTQDARIDLHAIRTAQVVSFTVTLDIGATPAPAFEQTLAELYTLIAGRQAAEVG